MRAAHYVSPVPDLQCAHERLGSWWVHKVKVDEIVDAELLELQHDRAEVGAQNLRVRVLLQLFFERLFGVQAEGCTSSSETATKKKKKESAVLKWLGRRPSVQMDPSSALIGPGQPQHCFPPSAHLFLAACGQRARHAAAHWPWRWARPAATRRAHAGCTPAHPRKKQQPRFEHARWSVSLWTQM